MHNSQKLFQGSLRASRAIKNRTNCFLGMGADNQGSTEYIIEMGGNIEAKDTYDYRPLHRMASNNLAIGAEALLRAGADLNAQVS